jgi:hypothetical protein
MTSVPTRTKHQLAKRPAQNTRRTTVGTPEPYQQKPKEDKSNGTKIEHIHNPRHIEQQGIKGQNSKKQTQRPKITETKKKTMKNGQLRQKNHLLWSQECYTTPGKASRGQPTAYY